MFYDSSYPLELGAGITVLHNLWLINSLAVKLPPPPLVGPDLALAFLQALPNVQGIYDDLLTVVDPICPTAAPPSQESYPWGLQRIEVPAVHQQPPGLQGAGVTVAVLDTGIDSTHLNNPLGEFYLRDAGGYNALPGGVSYFDDHGHGTHMAGIIAANLMKNIPSSGVIGAAPQARLAAVKVLDDKGAGYSSDVINGLQWVAYNGIPLVNMSFGFESPSTPLRQAIQSLDQNDIIMVASAGNRCAAPGVTDEGGGDDCGPAATCTAPRTAVMYPAAYPAVIAVAATTTTGTGKDEKDEIAGYSLAGTGNEVDAAAPGGGAQPDRRILSTNKGGGYGLGYGTSQAAAHFTGAVALALQLQPELSLERLREILKTTDAAEDLGYPKAQQGEGLIKANELIKALP